MWKTSLPFLFPPLANPPLKGEGRGAAFITERGFYFPPFLVGKGDRGVRFFVHFST
jgi:hypothetical protein